MAFIFHWVFQQENHKCLTKIIAKSVPGSARRRVRVCPLGWRAGFAEVGPVNIFLTFRKFGEVFMISLPTRQPRHEEGRRCAWLPPRPPAASPAVPDGKALLQGSWGAWGWFDLGKQEAAAGVGSGCCSLASAVASRGDEMILPLICSGPAVAAELFMEPRARASCPEEPAWLWGCFGAHLAGRADLQPGV